MRRPAGRASWGRLRFVGAWARAKGAVLVATICGCAAPLLLTAPAANKGTGGTGRDDNLLAFGYAGSHPTPLRSSLEVLGVVRGRLVVGFHEALEQVTVSSNGTELKPFEDNDWRMQDRRYGERDCRYLEFPIPALPAEVSAIGRVSGLVRQNVSHFLAEETVPSAAQWAETFIRKRPPKSRRQLKEAPERGQPGFRTSNAGGAGAPGRWKDVDQETPGRPRQTRTAQQQFR
ncbi:unnamed protein product [Polarella glacialis]|uniref:Uncharacterized protein n=1 Tax=Polarella glacialis TaxID=89957 RepID=A0A813K571_POLGL|nr:unnamed protein product [Polarella glacialis]